MKRLLKILSVIMSVIIFMGVFSAANPTLAAGIQNSEITQDTQITDTVESSEDAPDDVYVLNEITDLRDEYTKHFRQSDGSYIAAQYSSPVHYQKNGKWVEYDFTIEEKDSTDSVFAPVSSDIPVQFPSRFSKEGNNEINIRIADTTISFAPKSFQNGLKNSSLDIADESELVSSAITSADTVKTYSLNEESDNRKHKDQALSVDKSKGAVKYENVFDDVDIEYELSGNILKESIVLEKPQKKNVFEFTMNLGGLYPQKNPDGSIVLYTDSECTKAQSVIAAPYMIDAAGVYSDAVSMELKPDGNEYTLLVTADKNWLNDKDRTYPVIIDPTIILDIAEEHTIDCYVDDSEPNTSFPFVEQLYAGNNSYGKTRTFVKFILPALPDKCCVIQNASINFFPDDVDVGTEKRYISVHMVTKNWDNTDNRPTWNKQPGFETEAMDYAELTHNLSEYYRFDITRAVKLWYEKGGNYGVMLKGLDESLTGRIAMVSAEHEKKTTQYPQIVVTYRNNKGYEDYWTYTNVSAGSSVGSVNDYTGNLVYEIPLASSVSEIMPVSLSLVYNTYTANQVYVSGKKSSFLTTPGKGWKLNIQETVIKSSEYGLSKEMQEYYPYVYMDGDGTEHYFKKVTKKDDNGNDITVLEDEDNLGLTLDDKSTDTYKYKITDKNDTQYLFNGKGNLGIIQDSNGNRIKIDFNDDRTKITKVTDGSGHTFNFTYHINDAGKETDYMYLITDNAGRETKLHFPEGYLDTVTYCDNSKMHITYESEKDAGENGVLNQVVTSDGNGVNFDYTTKETGLRVKKITELGTNIEGTIVGGQIITFDRSEYNTTVIRTGGIDGYHYVKSYDSQIKKDTDTNNDGKLDGNDDIITTLQFDNAGRTISQQVSYGDGGEIGAGAYNYGNAAGSKNKVLDSATLNKNTKNILTNPNAETLSGWEHFTTENLTTQSSVASDNQYTGKKSLKIKTTVVQGIDAKSYYRQIIPGTYSAESYYTLSAFVKTKNIVQANTSGYQGAYIQLVAYDANNTVIAEGKSQLIASTTETGINNGWRRVSVSVQIPEDEQATKLTAYLCLRDATGEAYFDCMQLENGNAPTSVNLLENASFEKQNSNGTPTNWTTAGNCDTLKDKVTAANEKEGSKSIVINGSASLSKGYMQSIPVQPNVDDTYIVSGWAKADAVNSTFHSHYEKNGTTISDDDAEEIFTNTNKKDDETVKLVDDSKFEISVAVKYQKTDGQGNSTEVTQYKESAKFNTTVSEWQYTATPVSLKYTDGESGYTYTPTYIYVMPRYNKQVNCAYFDHIQLIKDAAQSYVYDDEGNLVSVTANAEQKNNMSYDGEDNLTVYKDAIGCTTTFTYQENTHNLLSVKTPKGVINNYTYNGLGQATVSETQNKAGELKIKTQTGYTADDTSNGITAGAYVSYTSDEHGNRTTYGYDMATGGLKTITDANGVKTTNAYYTHKDSSGKEIETYTHLKSVSSGGSKVSYTYDGNRIKSIDFGVGTESEKYSFTYDSYGNVLKTKVGNATLSTNEYGSHNGLLEQSVYGNDDGVRYEYDNSGRVIQQDKIESIDASDVMGFIIEETSYLWTYSTDGTPRTHTDYENYLKYNYSYDSIGRLIRTDIQNLSNNDAVGSIEYGFNSRGHMTSLKSEIGGRTHAQAYSYSKITDDNGNIINNSFENGKDGLPTRYKISSTRYADYSYDSLNRLNQRKFSTSRPLYNNYLYKTSDRDTGNGTYRTNQLGIEIIDNTAYKYTYDKVGNITKIEKGTRTTADSSNTATGSYTTVCSYVYDDLGQLVRENNVEDDKTYVWNYDALGNIESLLVYGYTTGTVSHPESGVDYQYTNDGKNGWNRLLTALVHKTYSYPQEYPNGKPTIIATETLNYDVIGNPISYRGATTLWYGRQLTSYSKGNVTATFKYDADGLRGSKVVNNEETNYFYVGDKLMYECRPNGKELYFYYDSYNNLSAIRYISDNDDIDAYFFVTTNAQGDVLGIYTNSGLLRASYEYDTWGNATVYSVAQDNDGENVYTKITNEATSGNIGAINPIRYRGYYYDKDLGLYYLQSRYYDATIGRFLNADGTLNGNGDIIGFNMYAYCSNNPIMFSDPGGCGIWQDFKNWVSDKINTVKEKFNKKDKKREKSKIAVDNTEFYVREGTKNNKKFFTVDVQIDLTNADNILYGDELTSWVDSVYDESVVMTQEYSKEDLWLMSKSHLKLEYIAHRETVNLFENSQLAELNVEENLISLGKRGLEAVLEWDE